MSTPTAYPLAWPPGRPRTPASQRNPAKFRSERDGRTRHVTMADARSRLQAELDMLRAGSVVLSTDVELRLDGQPRSGSEPADPGAACYFVFRRALIVLSCDRWDTVAGNVAAIAAHIKAMRGQDRWGVGTLEQAFAGYSALPAATTGQRPWRDVLCVSPGAALAAVEANYRILAKKAHPDAPGGSHEEMAKLNAAIAEARNELSR